MRENENEREREREEEPPPSPDGASSARGAAGRDASDRGPRATTMDVTASGRGLRATRDATADRRLRGAGPAGGCGRSVCPQPARSESAAGARRAVAGDGRLRVGGTTVHAGPRVRPGPVRRPGPRHTRPDGVSEFPGGRSGQGAGISSGPAQAAGRVAGIHAVRRLCACRDVLAQLPPRRTAGARDLGCPGLGLSDGPARRSVHADRFISIARGPPASVRSHGCTQAARGRSLYQGVA